MSKKVLIVDDDVDVREAVADMLGEEGYEVITAEDGLQALKTLTTYASDICVILLDLMMPNMDGREFRRQQLVAPAIAAIPVIVVSAFNPGAVASELSAKAFLPKPFEAEQLQRVVVEHCGTR